VKVIDKGQVHQDHAVAVRGVCASLAPCGGGLFQICMQELRDFKARGAAAAAEKRATATSRLGDIDKRAWHTRGW